MSILMKKRMITIIFLLGALADALWVVGLAIPDIYTLLTGNIIAEHDLATRLIMGVAGSLMAGWTSLLVWGSLDPIKRRIILLFTIFPTLSGISFVTFIGIINGHTGSTWIFGKCIVLSILLLTGFIIACRVNSEQEQAHA